VESTYDRLGICLLSRKAVDLIEASGFDYMILRPAGLTDHNEVNSETTGLTSLSKALRSRARALLR
jgi:hypothetical protein